MAGSVYHEAAISLRSFILGIAILTLLIFSFVSKTWKDWCDEYWLYALFVYCPLVLGIIRWTYREADFQVAIRACCLGLLLVVGVSVSTSVWSFHLIGWYIVALSVFHWSEYFATAVTNRKNLSLSSYLLDHSTAYHIAVVCGFVEFLLEWYFVPDWKVPNLVTIFGLIMVIGGEMLRKLAMWTAGSNFNHYIRFRREAGHQLVTGGVFAYCRHPSYVGWFYWSIGTQVMLLNPICAVLYAIASWKFFDERVREEELTLLNFFGEDYLDYQRRVGTGLPFIKGWQVDV